MMPFVSSAPLRTGILDDEAYSLYYSQALEDVEARLAGRPIRVIAHDSAGVHERQA